MPTPPDRRRPGRPLWAAAAFAATVAVTLAGCGRTDTPMNPTSPTATASGSASPGSGTASPDLSASPGGTATPGRTASPGGTATPGGAGTPGGSGSPTASVAPVSCTSVTPIRIERSTVEPRRTTEVITLVSDGRNLTPGTREQTAFAEPVLLAPDGTTTIDDEATLNKIVDLIKSSSKSRVLLARPDAPDTGVDANKRPFDSTGTYVIYSASGLLTADVTVDCSGQEQRWRFTAEADNSVGTINCAVEPPKGNAVARQVYGTFC